MTLLYMARIHFHFTHPEGCPEPGNGEEELEESGEVLQDDTRPAHLQPPADHRRSFSARRHSVHSVHSTSSSNPASPSRPAANPSASVSDSGIEQCTALAAFASKLTASLAVVKLMPESGLEVHAVDFEVIPQTEINLDFCRRQLAASYTRSHARHDHQVILTDATVDFFVPMHSHFQQPISPGLGASSSGLPRFDDQDSTLQIGTSFVPDRVFNDIDMSDVTAQEILGMPQLQGLLSSSFDTGAGSHEPSRPNAPGSSPTCSFPQRHMPNP